MMEEEKVEINLPEIQEKLYQRLKDSGWGDKLKGFLLSGDMLRILEQLMEQSNDGAKFTPRLKQIFRFLEECPYDKLKLIMMLQDPYAFLNDEGETVADGIPMSCSNTKRIQPSLRFVHQAIGDTVFPGERYRGPVDLKVWANQGVLLMNAAITTTIGKTGVHYKLWQPFVVYILDMLAWGNGGLIYLYMGKKAQEYMKITPSNNYKIMVTHPAYAAHTKADSWDSENCFVKINELLTKNGKEIIKW